MTTDTPLGTPANSATAAPISVAPLLIPDTEAAALCACSRSHWHALAAAGKVPPSIKLGRKRLWRRAEVVAWIDAGCPDGRTWERRARAVD